MAKRKRRRTRGKRQDQSPKRDWGWLSPRAEGLLHSQTPDERSYKFLLIVLALAFAARASIALCGDFVLHPDEIMQHLEPAHLLVFGNGVTYWEFFYGARAWLVPGAIACALSLFKVLGLGDPFWYIGGVKLMFCAISLLIPAGMYFFARQHFGETSARVALLAGAFWYELVGFAHKPMTGFVSTALLLALLALCVHPSRDRRCMVYLMAFVAVLATAVRWQYASVALLLLGLFFLLTSRKKELVVVSALFLLAAGIFDGVMWDGNLFHSYVTNIRFNLVLHPLLEGESPAYQYLWWLWLASAGLSVFCTTAALWEPRRHGLLLVLLAVILVSHSMQVHKEYRYVFATIPLWLLLGADVVARLSARVKRPRHLSGLFAVLFAAVSLCGILNALPAQNQVYRAYSKETGKVQFIRDQDPVFAAYRYLAHAPGVLGVWHADRPYFNLPGYYYLHHKIPFYDFDTGRMINTGLETTLASVSHIVAEDPVIVIPSYTVVKQFGDIRIWRRDENDAPVRQWEAYNPTITGVEGFMAQVNPNAPTPPDNMGIRFVAPTK